MVEDKRKMRYHLAICRPSSKPALIQAVRQRCDRSPCLKQPHALGQAVTILQGRLACGGGLCCVYQKHP